MILCGPAQEVSHWVSSSNVSTSLRLSEALNLSTVTMKPNSTIRSHKLLWLLGLTTSGFSNRSSLQLCNIYLVQALLLICFVY